MFTAFVDTILGILELVVLLVLAHRLLMGAVEKIDNMHNAIAVSKELKAEIQSNGDDTK